MKSYSISIGLMCSVFLGAIFQTQTIDRKITKKELVYQSTVLDKERELLEKIKAIATDIDGVVGISALDCQGAYSFGFNEHEFFPMASVYKVPIALTFLSKVDKRAFSLETCKEIKVSDLRPGDGVIAKRFSEGMALSYKDLLRLMLEVSDNTATDIILSAVGGPSSVTQWLRTVGGIKDIRVDRSTFKMVADYYGITCDNACTLDYYRKQQKLVSPHIRKTSSHLFCSDPQDTATPQGMTCLLKKAYTQKLLKTKTTLFLFNTMRLCQTGNTRIAGLLPEGIAKFQKTGSLYGGASTDLAITNDVGIIELPGKKRPIALAIFIKNSKSSLAQREKTIALIARALFDHIKELS